MSEADPVAVVGLGCVYPGAADVEAFWDGIVAGRDAITDAPADRLDPCLLAELAGSDHLASPRGGFVAESALSFEPGRFGIMPVAAADAEPDQLLALKTAAAALDDAGGLEGVARDRVGVILGRGGYLTPGLVRLDQRVRTANQLLETLRQLLPDVGDDRLVAVRDQFADQLGERAPGVGHRAGAQPGRLAHRQPARPGRPRLHRRRRLRQLAHRGRLGPGRAGLGPVRRGAGRRGAPLPRHHPVVGLRPAGSAQHLGPDPPVQPSRRRHPHRRGHRGAGARAPGRRPTASVTGCTR